MGENNHKNLFNFLKKFLEKIKTKFSLHYVAYASLLLFAVFSVASYGNATTPNPGHPWSEVGDGVFAVSGPTTTLRTYTFPDANATVLTSYSAVTVPQGGTGLSSIPDKSLLVTTADNTLSTLVIGAGQSIRRNATDTAFEAYTPASTSGFVAIDQSSPQTIGTTGNRLAKLWATDITVTNTIVGSVTGNAGTVTNGVYTNASNVFSEINPATTAAESWIGPSSTSGIYFKGGNVGIGETSPLAKLVVNKNTTSITPVTGSIMQLVGSDGDTARFEIVSSDAGSSFAAKRGNGTLASPSGILNNQNILTLTGFGHDGTAYGSSANVGMNFVSGGTWSETSHPTYIQYLTTNVNSTTNTERMRITPAGYVGIANTNPSYQLDVGGTVYATNFLVANNQSYQAKRAGGTVQDVLQLDSGDDIQIGSSALANDINLRSSSGTLMTVLTGGNTGIGVTNPTAALHLKAGTTSAGTAPLKLTSGSKLSSPEDGAIEYDGTHFYGTVGTTRHQLDQQAALNSVVKIKASNETITNTIFFVFPWQLIICLIVIILIILYFGKKIITRYNRYIIKKARAG